MCCSCYIYIYIYREREREKEMYSFDSVLSFCWFSAWAASSASSLGEQKIAPPEIDTSWKSSWISSVAFSDGCSVAFSNNQISLL